jgi:hypothetical protein
MKFHKSEFNPSWMPDKPAPEVIDPGSGVTVLFRDD